MIIVPVWIECTRLKDNMMRVSIMNCFLRNTFLWFVSMDITLFVLHSHWWRWNCQSITRTPVLSYRWAEILDYCSFFLILFHFSTGKGWYKPRSQDFSPALVQKLREGSWGQGCDDTYPKDRKDLQMQGSSFRSLCVPASAMLRTVPSLRVSHLYS